MNFWARVEKTTGCWIWLGPPTAGGYGQLRVNGMVTAHRHAVVLDGRDPTGKHVHHLCGNRLCVKPDHLEVLANNAEHHARHRRGCGRRHGTDYMTVIRSGRWAGRRYCAECNREKARKHARAA